MINLVYSPTNGGSGLYAGMPHPWIYLNMSDIYRKNLFITAAAAINAKSQPSNLTATLLSPYENYINTKPISVEMSNEWNLLAQDAADIILFCNYGHLDDLGQNKCNIQSDRAIVELGLYARSGKVVLYNENKAMSDYLNYFCKLFSIPMLSKPEDVFELNIFGDE